HDALPISLRSTLRHSTQDQEAPLARTTVTNGEVDTSSMLRVRICAIGAEIGTAMVNTGRISPSHGPGLITEIQPSWKENTWMSMMPSQNTGTATNNEGTARSTLPIHASRR